MQSLNWYIKRLKSMAPAEIAWRIQSACRDILDGYRIPAGIYPDSAESLKSITESDPPFRLADFPPSSAINFREEWRERLITKAEQICAHKLTFFELEDHFLGNPIDWHKDHASGQKAPLIYIGKIDYRDFGQTGDCKLVWEPSRHHQLVVLARAYRITGDRKYAHEVINQIDSWLKKNPFGFGMNWRSPMELSIRILNWVWALDLINESGLFAGEPKQRILRSVYLHLWEITRKFSQGSSANNHLIGEAAGVFIASCYFSELKDTDKWRAQSRDIIAREIHHQTYADGCNKELAYGYQLFVMQFLMFSGIVARKAGCDFTEDFWKKLEMMVEFSGALGEAGGLPNYGDADDGYVLDLGATHSDAKYLVAAGAILFNRPDFKAQAGEFPEPVYWLLGPGSMVNYRQIKIADCHPPVSRAFPYSGFYLLQSGNTLANSLSVLFDCGDLGFQSIAAHGHADALSFTLRFGGEDLFVDPGTFDYFTYPDYRHYFRKTIAHNTIEIDGLDQSEILGSFMWGKKAHSHCLEWTPGPEGQGGMVSAEHDGYTRLTDPVVHRRSIRLEADKQCLTIDDEIMARDEHQVKLNFHLAEGCEITQTGNNCYGVMSKTGSQVTIEFETRLTVEVFRGQENPISGWHSNSYHRKTPINTIQCTAATHGNSSFLTLIRVIT